MMEMIDVGCRARLLKEESEMMGKQMAVGMNPMRCMQTEEQERGG